MEPAAAGALYAVETLLEGALALAKGIYNPTMPLKATFTQIPAPSLPRSSHTLSVVKGRAYIFGGEIEPRKPVDNSMHMVVLPSSGVSDADYREIPAQPESPDGEVPAARVGHTAATIDSRIYIFGGRGGPDMKSLDDGGRLWVFSTTTSSWSYLDPAPSSPVPESRSYHASCATDLPSPTPTSGDHRPQIDNLPQQPPDPEKYLSEPPDPDSYGTVFIHAGCLSSGGRVSDLWAFDIRSRTWTQFPDAPGPARGGTSMAMVEQRIYRFGGFDGTHELGGQLDFLDICPPPSTGTATTALAPLGPWQSHIIPPSTATTNTDTDTTLAGPTPRSVAALLPLTTGAGRSHLLLLFGERSPSSGGHSAAGSFHSDAWSFQLPSAPTSAASFKDAARRAINKDTAEAQWAEVKYYVDEGVVDDAGVMGETGGGNRMVQEGQGRAFGGRGWFAASAVGDVDGGTAVVWGGIEEGNKRLGDGWMVTVE